jgi:opacity protein-like surface antigen
MSKRILVLAALAAVGFSGAAFAAETTKGSTAAPAAMTDSQMDAVTAGAPGRSGDSSSFHSCEHGTCVITGNQGNQGNDKPVGNAGDRY